MAVSQDVLRGDFAPQMPTRGQSGSVASDTWEALYDRHSGEAFALAQRLCGPKRAEQIFEQAFVVFWRQAQAGVNDGPSRESLLRATRQCALDLGPLHDAETRTQGANGSGTLAGLAPDERRCIELAYFDGLGVSEIASSLNVAAAQVKDRLCRGLKRVEAELSDLGKNKTSQTAGHYGREL